MEPPGKDAALPLLTGAPEQLLLAKPVPNAPGTVTKHAAEPARIGVTSQGSGGRNPERARSNRYKAGLNRVAIVGHQQRRVRNVEIHSVVQAVP